MTRFSWLIVWLIIFHQPGHAQIQGIPAGTQRIVFLGNSITYAGQYVSYIEDLLTLRYPELRYEFINVGRPSETVSGLSEPNHAGGRFPRPMLQERLERVLQQTKPQLILACYGMNDGIYLPYSDERFQKFKDGIRWLHEAADKAGASIIHITPPVFDERKGPAYANVLDLYSDWLISCRYTLNWQVIDIHGPMKKYLEDQRLIDSSFMFARDGIHPDALGHFVMAKQILLSLGETDIRNATDIHAAIAKYPHGEAILQLVEKRQAIMKDAWLTATGHTRPEMNKGLPIAEAQQQYDAIERQIRALLKEDRHP